MARKLGRGMCERERKKSTEMEEKLEEADE